MVCADGGKGREGRRGRKEEIGRKKMGSGAGSEWKEYRNTNERNREREGKR